MKILNVTHGSFYALARTRAPRSPARGLAKGYAPMLSYAVLFGGRCWWRWSSRP